MVINIGRYLSNLHWKYDIIIQLNFRSLCFWYRGICPFSRMKLEYFIILIWSNCSNRNNNSLDFSCVWIYYLQSKYKILYCIPSWTYLKPNWPYHPVHISNISKNELFLRSRCWKGSGSCLLLYYGIAKSTLGLL